MLCVKSQMLMLLVATFGIFCLIQFHLKGNNESKSVSKMVVQCRFQSIISRNLYKKLKKIGNKWYNLTWPCNSPKFNLHHLQEISTGFKMIVLTPKVGMSIPLHTKFLVMKYFKSSNYQRKTQ